MPFITNLSDRNIFRDFPTIFSTEPSQADEGIPIIAEFIKELGFFNKVGFVGRAGAGQSAPIGSGLLARLGFETLAWDHRIKLDGALATTEQINKVVKIAGKPLPGKEEGKTELASLIVVDLNGEDASQLIKSLHAAKLTPAIFFMGDIDRLSRKVTSVYPNAIYQLVWDRPPEVDSNNIIELISEEKPDQGLFAGRISLERIPEVVKNRIRNWDRPEQQHQWVFAGRKNMAAAGWSDAEQTCAKEPKPIIADPLQEDNLRAIAAGAQFADLLKLIVTAARTAGPGAKIDARRAAVVSELKQTYADGKGAFKGRLRNWSFSPDHRTATRKPFVVILPHGLGRTQLAPVQFARTKKAQLRKIDTLYLDIDLIRAHSIDDNRKSFLADFYIAMRGGNNATVQSLDFTNAYLDPRTGGRQISIQTLHGGGPSAYYPDAMRIYRVSGRFLFDPKLANYPFDSQHFTIDIRPNASNERPFIVQPPPLRLRDKQLTTDGWILKTQYVGYAADFVPVVDAYSHEPSVIPFYTASFVWKMKRETTDYFLRVVVPLAFILIVAYLSIFIPQSHLEAIVTIQITALLSAVALYLSLPKLEADTATISDRIFVFDYMMVSFMIVISILRINKRIAKWKMDRWRLELHSHHHHPDHRAVDGLLGLPGQRAVDVRRDRWRGASALQQVVSTMAPVALVSLQQRQLLCYQLLRRIG